MARPKIKRKGLDWKELLGEEIFSRTRFNKSSRKCSRRKWTKRLEHEKGNGRPSVPSFEYHLGMIYRAANQRSEAERALKKAIASSRAFKEKSDAEAALKDIDHWRHLVSSNK